MRQGELLGFRWQDVNLTFGTISIQQTFYRLGKKHLFKQPKRAKSRRMVAIAPALVEELRQGVHPKVVQERLGHSGIAITMDVYSHVLPGMQEQAARTLEARLLGVTGTGD
jgi:integrase